MPSPFEVLEDTPQGWQVATRGEYLKSILLVAPSIFPARLDLRYAGIERLVALFARELAIRGYEVTVAAASGSAFGPGVRWIDTGVGQPLPGDLEEESSYLAYRPWIDQVQAVHDFSHRHLAMRRHKVRGVAMTWHDPRIMTPPEPDYNVATLSEWGADRFRQTTGQEARALDVVCGDPDFYEPYFRDAQLHGLRNAFVTLGKMHPTKGNLEVTRMCAQLGLGLDIVGGFGPGDEEQYANACRRYERGGEAPIAFRGEVSEEAKAWLLATSRALLYAPQYEPGTGEQHLHKCVDGWLAGCPSLLLDRGAYREVMAEGVTGYLADDMGDFQSKIMATAVLDRVACRAWAVARYGVGAVVDRWIPIYESLMRWEDWR